MRTSSLPPQAWLEEQLLQECGGQGAPHSQGGGASAVYSPWQHLSNIPDTLYMVDKAPGFRESCPSLPSLTASGTHRGPDPTLPGGLPRIRPPSRAVVATPQTRL